MPVVNRRAGHGGSWMEVTNSGVAENGLKGQLEMAPEGSASPSPVDVATCGKLAASSRPGPNDFLLGVGISMYQNSGCGGVETNWSVFGQQRGCCGLGSRRVHNSESPDDTSPDFWNNYEEDIRLVKGLGSNCFRFSFEWGRLEPSRACWDESAFQRYSEILECLERHGIEPVATLHHFVHPWWFEKLGGFDDIEQLPHFVTYCEKVFERFGGRIRLWLTINEVAVMPYTGYIYGSHPPGASGNFYKAGIQYRNLLIAHARVYKSLKAMPHGKTAKIGIVHDWLVFEPKERGIKYVHIRPIANLMNRVWGNDQFIEFFKKGTFTWSPLSFSKSIFHEEEHIPGLDWVGLNYYSRAVLSSAFSPVCHDHEVMTEMPYGVYPEGMFLAIQYCAQLDVPIYITETGIADRQGRNHEHLIRQYFNQVKLAMSKGYDVRGLMYWTLVDNFEWSYGFTKHFGLYEWVKDTNERRPRPGVQIIRDQFKDMASFTRLQASGSSGVLIAAGENIGVDTVMPLLISNGN